MAKNKKKYVNVDKFIAQTLSEFEGADNNKKTIILVIVAVVILAFGFGVYYFVNNVEINYEFRLPWQSKDDDPLFTIKKSGNGNKKDKEVEEELVVPTFLLNQPAGSAGITKCSLKGVNISHDNKGYVVEIEITPKATIDFKLEKVLLDGYPFDVDYEVKSINQKQNAKFRINQTDLDRYEMIAFKRMTLYFSTVEVSKNEKHVGSYSPAISNNIVYDNSKKGLIEIYNYGTNVLSFYKTETDKDNTYIYFFAENVNKNVIKEYSVKKLLINGDLFKMEDFSAEVYYGAHDIFYLSIPKKKIREVENFTVSFFITEINEKNKYNSAVYQTNDYTKELK